MAGHVKIVCPSCSIVVRQCRCPGPHPTEYQRCSSCQKAFDRASEPKPPDYRAQWEELGRLVWEVRHLLPHPDDMVNPRDAAALRALNRYLTAPVNTTLVPR